MLPLIAIISKDLPDRLCLKGFFDENIGDKSRRMVLRIGR
jgi:hypothetical protein